MDKSGDGSLDRYEFVQAMLELFGVSGTAGGSTGGALRLP